MVNVFTVWMAIAAAAGIYLKHGRKSRFEGFLVWTLYSPFVALALIAAFVVASMAFSAVATALGH